MMLPVRGESAEVETTNSGDKTVVALAQLALCTGPYLDKNGHHEDTLIAASQLFTQAFYIFERNHRGWIRSFSLALRGKYGAAELNGFFPKP